MGETTGITWCHHTHNRWWGCTKKIEPDIVEEQGSVDDACVHCYADSVSKRAGLQVWGATADRRFFGVYHLNEPLRWARAARKRGVGKTLSRERVFCGSMMDIFERHAIKAVDEQMDSYRRSLYPIIEQTEDVFDYLLLTKRPENMLSMLPPEWLSSPRPNVWLGVTAAGPKALERRLLQLNYVPAAAQFVSWEPAIRPLDNLEDLLKQGRRLDWLIGGCESRGFGLGRPANLDWFRNAVKVCNKHGVSYFQKQMDVDGKLCKDPAGFPADLRVQQFPIVRE
jgi:protein gp37